MKTTKERRTPVKRASVARGLIETALAEVNRACQNDEVINQSKPLGRAVEYLNASLVLLGEDWAGRS